MALHVPKLDESRQKLFAETYIPTEFAACEYMLSLTYQPGFQIDYALTNTGAFPTTTPDTDSIRSMFLFHTIFPPYDVRSGHADPTLPTYMPPPALLQDVNKFMRKFVRCGHVSPKPHSRLDQLREEIKKHAHGLRMSKEVFTQTSMGLCNQLGVDGLLRFLFEEGVRRHLIVRPCGIPRGWWGIHIKSMCEILHEYPKLGGRKMSFKFGQKQSYYFLKEIIISLRLVDAHAKRLKPVFVLSPGMPQIPSNAITYFMNL